MRLVHQDWVCLATEDELHAARKRNMPPTAESRLITSPLWRQVQVRGSTTALLLELCSVAEDCSQGGLVGGAPALGVNAMRYGFAWEDLDDSEFLCKLLAREQFIVGTRVLRILDSLKRNRTALQNRLACSGANRA